MKRAPLDLLESCLTNPLDPRWSSQLLVDMFDGLKGHMKEKQLLVLPIIDEKLSKTKTKMTDFQYHFLRDVTLHAVYTETYVEFKTSDLKWLLERFDHKPTQQRATLITLLLDLEDLNEERNLKIKELLKGTLAE